MDEQLHKLMLAELKDVRSAESQIIKALPPLIKKVSDPHLRESLTVHLSETEIQVDRLEQIEQEVETSLTRKRCIGMESILQEGKDLLDKEWDTEHTDLVIAVSSKKVETYEIEGYKTILLCAKQMGHESIIKLVRETLDEEEQALAQLNKSINDLFSHID